MTAPCCHAGQNVDDEAEGIVLERQELAGTIHFAHLVSAFLRTLEADDVDHVAAIALTQTWMQNERIEEDE